jgi:hypothetical protein
MNGNLNNFKNEHGRRKIFKIKRVKEGIINDE